MKGLIAGLDQPSEIKIFKILDPELKSILRDFRRPSKDGLKIFKHIPLDPINSIHVPVRIAFEVLPKSKWHRPNFFFRWLRAARPIGLSSSINPCLIALLIGLLLDFTPDWWIFWPSITGVLALHIGVNFLNDYDDHMRLFNFADFQGTRGTGGSGVIQNLWIPANHLKQAGILFLVLGVLFGIPALIKSPMQIGILGAVAIIGAGGYSGRLKLKYRALGDGAVVALLGPGVMVGITLATFDKLSLATLVAGIFFGFLAEGALHANNLQDIPLDTSRKIKTFAKTVGFRAAKNFLIWNYLTSFGLLLILAYVMQQPLILIAGIIMAPFVFLVLRGVSRAEGPLSASIRGLKTKTEGIHLGFSVMMLAILAGLLVLSHSPGNPLTNH